MSSLSFSFKLVSCWRTSSGTITSSNLNCFGWCTSAPGYGFLLRLRWFYRRLGSFSFFSDVKLRPHGDFWFDAVFMIKLHTCFFFQTSLPSPKNIQRDFRDMLFFLSGQKMFFLKKEQNRKFLNKSRRGNREVAKFSENDLLYDINLFITV